MPRMANAYEAGAAGLPCAVFRGYRGAGLAEVNPNIKSVDMPVHRRGAGGRPRASGPTSPSSTRRRPTGRATCWSRASSASRRKRCWPPSAPWSRSRRSSTISTTCIPICCVLPHWTIAAIAVVPGGAHPSYAHGYYGRDNAAYLEWDEIAADRDRFREWMDKQCHEGGAGRFRRARRRTEERRMSDAGLHPRRDDDHRRLRAR